MSERNGDNQGTADATRARAPREATMGKAKAKGRRGRDDDDFECAVQALEIDTPAAQPQQADEESGELDELLERALALCLLVGNVVDRASAWDVQK